MKHYKPCGVVQVSCWHHVYEVHYSGEVIEGIFDELGDEVEDWEAVLNEIGEDRLWEEIAQHEQEKHEAYLEGDR